VKKSPKKPPIARLAKLKDFDRIIVGRDFADALEEGYVYSVQNIMGEIVLTRLGEHHLIENYQGKTFTSIMMDGTCLLTKEEHKQISHERPPKNH
jgi:hypothetical protein